jgi:WD40 repeat protein
MNLPPEISSDLGHSTAEKPADTIFSGLSQIIQSVSVLQTQVAELEQLRCLSLVHVAQFKSDHELIASSYRRLRILLQQDPTSLRCLAAPNPLSSTDLKFRFTASLASEVTPDSLKLRHSLSTGNVLCSVQFSPDGDVIACADRKSLYLFSTSGGLLTQADLPGDPADCSTADPPRRLRFSPAGKLITMGTSNQAIALFSTETSQFLTILNGHEATVTALLFSGNARILDSGGSDGIVSLWDISTLRLLRQIRRTPHT